MADIIITEFMDEAAVARLSEAHDTLYDPKLVDDPVALHGLLASAKALVVRIVRARIDETLELIRDRIQRSGHAPVVGRRIVLTGGASQLTGISDAARRILSRNVRIGRPLGVAGMPAAAKGPAFATAVGLMIYPQIASLESRGNAGRGRYGPVVGGGRLARVGQWLKESF